MPVARRRLDAVCAPGYTGRKRGYELFITNLDANAFVAEDILDLYHGRGAFEAVLAEEDVEEDPDRWCSYTECGQEPFSLRNDKNRFKRLTSPKSYVIVGSTVRIEERK